MLIIGLTGSIGMGKTVTAGLFRELGVPVHDADAEVHALYKGPAVERIEAEFPGVALHGRVHRPFLSVQVLGDETAMQRLEAIIHPMVRERRDLLLANARKSGCRAALLDIPLLFETGAEKFCDVVAIVSAGFLVQKERVMARPGMTEEKFHAILARQMPDTEKRRRAHFIIDTGRGMIEARKQVDDLLRSIRALPGRKCGSLLAGQGLQNRPG